MVIGKRRKGKAKSVQKASKSVWGPAQFVFIFLPIIALLAYADHHDWSESKISWIDAFPLTPVWTTLLGSSFVILVFEILFREHSQRRLLTQILSPEVVRELIAEKQLLKILEACLERITKDVKFASDLVEVIRNNALIPEKRRIDYVYDAKLENIDSSANEAVKKLFFAVTLKISCGTTFADSSLKFQMVTSNDDYNAIRLDNSMEFPWIQPLPPDLMPFQDEFFHVDSLSIDGEDLAQKPNRKTNLYEYVVPLKFRDGRYHHIEYTLKILSRKTGHYLGYYSDQPTKGLTVLIDYSQVPISYMNIVDALATGGEPSVSYLPAGAAATNARAACVEVTDAWVFPKSAVTFIWRLSSETTPEFLSSLSTKQSSRRD